MKMIFCIVSKTGSLEQVELTKNTYTITINNDHD